MKQKLFTLSLALVASVGLVYASVTIDGIAYNLNETELTAEVTKAGNSGSIVIPSKVDYNDVSYSVTSIGVEAFRGCTDMTSVTIGESVTSIGDRAFYCCYDLTSVEIPNSVTTIGENAFYTCNSLTSVTIGNSVTTIGKDAFHLCYRLTSVHISDIAAWCKIDFDNSRANPLYYAHNLYLNGTLVTDLVIPNSVTSIGDYAFYGCSKLTSVTMGNSVTSIGGWAFDGCNSLTSVHISDIAAWCKIDFGSNPLSYAHNLYLNGTLVTDLVIPNSVTSIGNSAFNGCTGLTSVTIGESVTSIGDGAFSGCSGLTSITIPNSVTTIGNSAFYGCSGLTSVTIGESVTSIGDGAFSGCSGLTSVTIPNSVTSIGNSAFSGCTGLTSITIPNSVTSIGDGTFNGCNGLTSVAIPNSVTSIENIAFSGCSGLTSITIPNSVTSIGQNAFSNCSSVTSVVWNAKNCNGWNFGSQVTSFTFGEEVEVIPQNICSGMTNLTSITIPNSVTTIGNSAFSGCSGLTSVTISKSVTSIGENAFSGCTGLEFIYVHCESVDLIKELLPEQSSLVRANNIIEYSHLVGLVPNERGGIVIDIEPTECDSLMTISAIPNDGYYFSKWADGNKDNPRTVKVTNEPASYRAIFGQIVQVSKMTYLTTGGSDWGEMTTNNSDVWTYNSGYGAYGKYRGGSTGHLFTPAKDLHLAAKVNISFLHAHRYAGNPSSDFTLWVTKNYTGRWTDSEWQQLTISPYTSNNNWDFVLVTIDVPREYLGENTVFAFQYVSNSSNYGTWEIKNLKYTIYYFQPVTIQDGSQLTEGHIDGIGTFEYLNEEQLITAVPEYGYHFTQWSDGNSDNPRAIILTQDTTFTAEFAIDKSGTCGKENALTWSYEDESKTLTITGDGELTDNYTFGLEAPTQMKTLIIGDGVTAIGDRAFYETKSLNHLFIGANVASIGDYTFAECKNFDDITCYATTVPTVNATTFENVGNKKFIYLYVPKDRERAYQRDEFWGEFDVQVKSAETTTSDGDVIVVPTDNTAEISWPAVDDADTYEIEITKDGEVFCVLRFNANGQLTGIAFAPGLGKANQTEQAQTEGFKFTVTGLNSGTRYGYAVASKDSGGKVVDTKSGTFTTKGGIPTSVDDVQQNNVQTTKVFRNGQILILRGDKTYTFQGQEVK